MIVDATAEAVRPVAFSVLVIIVSLIPLFTMQGVPGKVFAPMSETYGFALTGAFLFAILFAPVLASGFVPKESADGTRGWWDGCGHVISVGCDGRWSTRRQYWPSLAARWRRL